MCQSQVAALQVLWDKRDLSVWGDTQLIVINSIGSEEGMPDLTDGVSLPVLQDLTSTLIFEAYGADKWYTYFIDAQGVPRILHYELHLPDAEARLLEFVAQMNQESR